MDYPEALTIERDGKVIGHIRSMKWFFGNMPVAEVVLDWGAVDEIMEALKGVN